MRDRLVTLCSLFANRDYRPRRRRGGYLVSAGLMYFALHARHHLVLSPEEQFAEEARLSLWAPTVTR